jgi:signal transduction histidine kinase
MMTLTRLTAWFAADDARPGTAAPPVLPPLSQRVTALARCHPLAADAVLAAAVAGLGVNALAGGGSGSTAVLAAFAAGMALPLIWRRRHPAGVFAVVCAVALAQWVYAQRVLGSFAILLALYSVARHASRRVTLAAAVTAEAAGAVAAVADGRNWAQFLAVLTAMIAAPVFLGSYLRTRQAYLSTLEERARRLEHERDQQAQIVAAAERASIAREMHDIVAHSLAVIITMAEAAAAKRRSDPDRAAAAMEQVAETGREALDQTRRVLGVLRPRSLAAPSPPPGLDQLDALLGQVRATGLTAELAVTGGRFPVPADAQLAVYRIVQEALTNTIRHSRGATGVQVRLEYADPVIEIDIADDGQPDAGIGHHGSAGHGLAGMRERAALYGGALVAGPRPGGGWRVSAGLSPAAQALSQPAP